MTDNTTAAGAKPGGIKGIFFGTQGLRAGWGALLFIAVVVGTVLAVTTGLHAIHFHGPKSDPNIADPISSLFQEGLLSAALVFATLVMVLIDRRPLSRLGLGLRNALPRLVQGLVTGVAAMSALIGILCLCGAIHVGALALHGADIWRFGAEWGGAFLLVGVFEELAFRTYLQQTLARGLNFRWAALIMAALFTLAHAFNSGEAPMGLVMVFVAALVFSLSVWRSGAVWWIIGFHAAWDWAESFVYGVADSGSVSRDVLLVSKPMGPDWLSGGATGPEGSVLALAVMAAVAGVIWLTLRKPDEDMGVKW